MCLVSTTHYIHRDIVENDNWLRMYALAMFLCASCFIKMYDSSTDIVLYLCTGNMKVFLLIVTLICHSSAIFHPQILPSDINVRVGCQAAIANPSALQLTHPKLMAQYWDSWGKLSDGMLYGHTAFLGYYDECIDLKNIPIFQLAVV